MHSDWWTPGRGQFFLTVDPLRDVSKSTLNEEIAPLEMSLIPAAETEALLTAGQDFRKHEPELPIELRASRVKRGPRDPTGEMTMSRSMNHCNYHFEVGVPSVSPRVEQMTHVVAEARQNPVTHRCSWTSCSSPRPNTVTSNLPFPSWCWWIAFLAECCAR